MELRETIDRLESIARGRGIRAIRAARQLWELLRRYYRLPETAIGAMYTAWQGIDGKAPRGIASVLTGLRCGEFSEYELNHNPLHQDGVDEHGNRLRSVVAIGKTIVVDSHDTTATDTLDTIVAGGDLNLDELLVVELLREGYTNREIADRLGVHEGTISRRVDTILEKLRNSANVAQV